MAAAFLLSAPPLPVGAQGDTEDRTTTMILRPTTAGSMGGTGATTDQAAAMRQEHQALRDRVAARVPNRAAGGADRRSGAVGRPVALGEGNHPGAGVTRNVRNPIASSEAGHTLAEPAAANDGEHVLYTGNTYSSFSADGGSTWAQRAIPPGPADAAVPCCDQDVVHDRAHDAIFWSALYLDEGLSNGVVRIFVGRSIPGPLTCSYVVDPGGSGDNVIPDYPHLAVSDGYLYLATTNLRLGEWTGSQVRRFPLSQMAGCEPVRLQTFSYVGPDQRVFVPAEGASSVAYWGLLETPTRLRVFRWPEQATSPSSVVRAISASTFVNPDCRGGADNSEFVERASAWSIAGFRLRGAVGRGRLAFYWNVGHDAEHPQGHVHGALFSERRLDLIDEPHLHNPGACIAYPAVGANARGEIGLSVAAGGRRGGHGPPARGWVGIGSPSQAGVSYKPFFLTAHGTHNPFDGRFGDYFTVRADSRCPHGWVATNYSLLGGNFSPSNVNARYVRFGSAGASCS